MATINEIVQRLVLEMETKGVKRATDEINDNTRAAENNASAAEANARAQTNFEKSSSRAADQLHRMRMRMDAVYNAQNQLNKATSALSKQGFYTESDLRVLELLTQKLKRAELAVNDNAAAYENLVAGMSAFGRKAKETIDLNEKVAAGFRRASEERKKQDAEAARAAKAVGGTITPGMSLYGARSDVGARMGAVGKARMDQETAASAARVSSMTALMSGYGARDDVASKLSTFAVTEAIKRDTAAKEANIAANKRLIDGMGALGKKSVESSEFIKRMTATTKANTTAVVQTTNGLTKLQKLTVQQTLGDVFSSLSTGQSPQTILLQQGEQFLQPFGTGLEGVKNAAKTLGPILMRLVFNPITLIGTAALTTAYAMDKWKESQDAVAVSLNGLARQAGLTLNQINAIAAATSNASTISNSTARTYATMFAGAGVSGAAIQPGLGLVDPLSRRLGVDQGEMAQTLAGALSAPGKGAEELARKFGLLTYAEQEQIKRLGETGEKTKATAKLIELLGGKIEEMDDPTTRFAAALEQAKKGFLNFIDSIGREAKQLYSPDSFDTVRSRTIRGQQSQKDAEASAAAARLSDLTKEYSPEYVDQQARNRQFQQLTKDLNNSRAMVMLDQDGAKAAESVEKFAAKMRALKETEAELTKRQSDANARSLSTYSEQIKAKTRADQEYTTEVRRSGDEVLANAKKHAVLKESLAQSSFALQNAARTAQDNLKMAGMTGLQRQKYQAFMEGRTLRETYGSDGGVQALMERAANTAFNKQTFTDPLSKLVDQQGVLSAQEKTLGMPLNEATAYVEQVRLTNEVMREQGFVTDEQRVKIQTLAEAMGEAAQAQEDFASKQRNLADAMDIVRSTTHDIGTSLAEAFRRGEDAGKALLNVLDRLASKLLDKTLDMAIDGLFGKMGGTSGGAFGSIVGGIGKMFSFANGGVMTSGGAVPLMAYANGGIANRPQMALFGEGRKPEAFVPLPDGRAIPVKMHNQQQQRTQVVINNNASGLVDLQAREDALTGRLLVTVNSMIASNNRKVPGMVADAQRRSL